MIGLGAGTRPLRFELLSLLVLGVLTVLVAGGVVLLLLSFGIPDECLGNSGGGESCLPYAQKVIDYVNASEAFGGPAYFSTVVLPGIAAAVLGVALVGKEIDQRTTVLAWSLAPSRGRWLLARVAPAVAGVALYGLIAGALGDTLLGMTHREIDQAHNFQSLGLRGLVPVGSNLLVLGSALLFGAILGRVLPALLLSGAFVLVALLAISNVHDLVLRGDSIIIPQTYERTGAREIDSLLRTPEGEIITWNEAYERYGPDVDYQIGTPDSKFTFMVRVVPGDVYPFAAARLALVEGAVGLLAIGLGFVVVQRRRP
jgi:hypothetical protein